MPLHKVLEKTFRSKVSEPINFDFEVEEEGFYLVKIIARAGAWWQKVPVISEKYRDDEELHLSLDGRSIKPYFNGNSLYGTRQNLLLFSQLSLGKHTITFKGKRSPFLEALQIYKCSAEDTPLDLLPLIDRRAEDTLLSVFISKLKRWIALASPTVPILGLSVEAQAKDGWQLFFQMTDDEDVQLIIDGEIQKNTEPKAHDNRYWCGHTLKGRMKPFNKTFTEDRSANLIEILSDRSPVINNFMVSFKRLPSVADPRWTGNFDDDGEVLLLARLILGEAENQPIEAKIGIGFTVLNRLKKQQPSWGFSVRDIIIKGNQYDGLWNKNTYGKVRDPLNNASEKRKQEWIESYEVAKNVLSRSVVDTVPGSTNFHSYTDTKDFPFWATDKNYRGKIGKTYFYELEK